jgi:hypothetical protein
MADNTVQPATKYDDYQESSATAQDIAAAKFNFLNKKAELQIENERWKTKKWMAWVCLMTLIVATGCMFFLVPQPRMASLDSVTSWFYAATTTIISAYIGSSTWERIALKKPEKPSVADVAGATPFDALNQEK